MPAVIEAQGGYAKYQHNTRPQELQKCCIVEGGSNFHAVREWRLFEGNGAKLEVASVNIKQFLRVRGPLRPQERHEHRDVHSGLNFPAVLGGRLKIAVLNWKWPARRRSDFCVWESVMTARARSRVPSRIFRSWTEVMSHFADKILYLLKRKLAFSIFWNSVTFEIQ